jgi:hypothetical protein
VDSAFIQSIAVDKVFSLPLVTGSTSAAAMQSYMSDRFGLIGVNGRMWRALRATNERRMLAALSFGTKFGAANWFESIAPRRGDRQ